MEALQAQLTQLLTLAPRLSYAELTDLAASLANNLQPGPVRAALIASKPADSSSACKSFRISLRRAFPGMSINRRRSIWEAENMPHALPFFFLARVLLPIWTAVFYAPPSLKLLLSISLLIFLLMPMENATEVAQPSITTASLAGLKVLEQLGVQAQVALGHSLGELSALHWAGAMDEATLLRLAHLRGAAMARVNTPSGAMLSIQADAQKVRELIHNTSVVISGLNSSRQTVIAGDLISVNKIAVNCAQAKIPCVHLAVSHAFHSPLVAPAVETLALALQQETF